MLAYVFWHWPHPGGDVNSYVRRFSDFHALLSVNRPPGFLSSAVFRIEGVAWAPSNIPVFEDWYLLDGSAALDPLNVAAVAPPLREPHDLAARAAAGGTAGLYSLRRGSRDVDRVRQALWFSKPPRETYDDLFRRIDPIVAACGGGLWGRQMILGPTPEFCLLSEAPVEWPGGPTGVAVGHDPVWP
ncbi:MAG: hypothetical protein KIT09_11040 [Bryobacteraceae bacterium]|nr:hypothetical protein [Bryobacteraceae bacterium]